MCAFLESWSLIEFVYFRGVLPLPGQKIPLWGLVGCGCVGVWLPAPDLGLSPRVSLCVCEWEWLVRSIPRFLWRAWGGLGVALFNPPSPRECGCGSRRRRHYHPHHYVASSRWFRSVACARSRSKSINYLADSDLEQPHPSDWYHFASISATTSSK